METSTKKKSSLSIAGFICSLCGFVTCGITSIIGLILSIIGLSESKKRGEASGLAIAGIVISAIPIVIGILFIGLGAVSSTNTSTTDSDNNITDSEEKNNINKTQKSPEEAKAEFISECESFNYKEIARQPDSYKGKKGKFRGKVIQVSEGTFDSNKITLRVNVTEGEYGLWDDTVYVTYKYKDGESKILEDDIINMYGIIEGTESYVSVFGAKITIPSMTAKYIDIE